MRDINVAVTGTLDASAKTVTFNTAIDKNKLLTIVNTTANVEIYTANDTSNGGNLDGTNTVLTLDYDTTSMNDADLIQVVYEGVASTLLATAAKQDSMITGIGTVITRLSTISQNTPAPGQAAMAGSSPVVIASDQSAVPVSASSLPLPTGAATAANQSTELTFLSAIQAQLVSNGAAQATSAKQDSQLTQETAAATSLAIIDDWDESDRAKVNPIAGQAGVDGGAGAVSSKTQRVVIVTDQTAIPASQSGTWTVQPGNTANTTAWKVDNSAVTQPTKIAYQTTKALTNAAISTTTSGEQTIVAGTSSQTIRVFRLSFTVSGATTVTIKDAAGGTTLASYDLVANGSLVLESTDGEPYFVTASSGAFIISSSNAVNIKGNVQYVKS